MSIETADKPQYSVNEKVLCRCEDGLYYEAKIVRVGRAEDGSLYYKVHYQGWSKTYDEVILQSMVPNRFVGLTPKTLQEALNARNARREMDRVDKDKKCKRRSRKSFVAVHKELECERVNDKGPDTATTAGEVKRLIRKRSFTSSSSCSEELNMYASPAVSAKAEVPVACGSDSDKSPTCAGLCQYELLDENFNSKWVSDPLLVALERDRQATENGHKLGHLPAKYTASKIVTEYAKHIRQINKINRNHFTGEKAVRWKLFMKGLDECAQAFLDFFDIVIPDRILNDGEKLRHQDLVDERVICKFDIADIFEDPKQGSRPSHYYGFIHVVRLLADFEDILKQWSAPGATTQVFEIFVRGFLRWLGENVDRYVNFAVDYEASRYVDGGCEGRAKIEALDS